MPKLWVFTRLPKFSPGRVDTKDFVSWHTLATLRTMAAECAVVRGLNSVRQQIAATSSRLALAVEVRSPTSYFSGPQRGTGCSLVWLLYQRPWVLRQSCPRTTMVNAISARTMYRRSSRKHLRRAPSSTNRQRAARATHARIAASIRHPMALHRTLAK